MLRKEFINSTPVSPSDGFGLTPLNTNGVKVGAARWKKLCLTLIGADRFQLSWRWWKLALSITITVPAGVLGHSSWMSQA